MPLNVRKYFMDSPKGQSDNMSKRLSTEMQIYLHANAFWSLNSAINSFQVIKMKKKKKRPKFNEKWMGVCNNCGSSLDLISIASLSKWTAAVAAKKKQLMLHNLSSYS